MKTILSILCVLFVLSTATATPLPKAKQSLDFAKKFDDGFTKINAHRQQGGILVTWGFTNSNNCVCFVIQRSYDGSYFETIAEVNTSTDRRNQFKDNAVYPGYVHYRIAAMMYDGSIIYSSVEIVRIVRNG